MLNVALRATVAIPAAELARCRPGKDIDCNRVSSGDRDKDEELAAGWTSVRAADLGFVLTRLTDLDRA
ncbi:hypothetical protein, partial [Amycolatopsis alba]|uniref:hypothetical protein n=1 Tax=Amycolatopsis alba TaxID=76020 RepID=UPI001177DF92